MKRLGTLCLFAILAIAACGNGSTVDEGRKRIPNTGNASDGAAVPGSVEQLHGPSAGGPAPQLVMNDYLNNIPSLPSLVDAVDGIVVATVVSEEKGKTTKIDEELSINRVLHLDVERVVLGNDLKEGSRVTMFADGWNVSKDGVYHPVVSVDGVRPEVGDRAIFGLTRANPGLAYDWGLTNDASIFFLRGGEVLDSHRTDPLVAEAEKMTEDSLVTLLSTYARTAQQGG